MHVHVLELLASTGGAHLDHLVCYTPKELQSGSASQMSSARWRLLAQGDTWFSTAAAKLDAHANLLQELVFKQPAVAINCAGSSDMLAHLVDLEAAPEFVRLLTEPGAPVWDGIMISAGGNDIIEAARVPAHPSPEALDQLTPLELRLLRHQTEWGPPSAGAGRYFSEPGWQTFAGYLRANVRHLLSLRDQGPSAGKPVFMHCYAAPMPRPAGAADAGPWLYPAFKAYAIPPADWLAVSRLLLVRLVQLLKSLAADKENFPGLFVFDSTAVPLALPAPGSTGISGDWHNEIHLNHSGCFKIGRAWSEHIEMVLTGGGLPATPTSGRRR